MDIVSLIEIVIVIAVAYFVIKFIVSPVLKIVSGIAIIIVTIFLLQRFFNFDLTLIFGPFAKYFNINNYGFNLNPVLGSIDYYINQIKNFLDPILSNIKK